MFSPSGAAAHAAGMGRTLRFRARLRKRFRDRSGGVTFRFLCRYMAGPGPHRNSVILACLHSQKRVAEIQPRKWLLSRVQDNVGADPLHQVNAQRPPSARLRAGCHASTGLSTNGRGAYVSSIQPARCSGASRQIDSRSAQDLMSPLISAQSATDRRSMPGRARAGKRANCLERRSR